MNLPSIFKSTPVMKSSNPTTNNNKDKFEKNMPQDMFGLGIQVFKIQSKKQISQPNSNNAKSLGKARQNMNMIQNPTKKLVNVMPTIPKPKKTSAVLPSINKTPSQKQYRVQGIMKSDSIMNRKSVEKTSNVTSKMDSIQEYNQPIMQKNGVHKNKTFVSSRSANKSMDVVPQPQSQTSNNDKFIIKQQWRSGFNVLRKFLTQCSQFHGNQQSKAGRKKNTQFLGDEANFVEAYVTNSFNQTNSTVNSHRKNLQLFQQQDKQNQYDPYSIQYYIVTKNKEQITGFIDNHFQDYNAHQQKF